MPDIDSVAGSATGNSFASTDEGDTYCDARLNSSAWTGASEDNKARALIEATREINQVNYRGDRTTFTQVLAWPRNYAINPDLPQIIGVKDISQLYYANTVVPDRIKNATIELALEFLRAGTTDIAALDSKINIKRKKVDVLETEFVEPDIRPQGLARFPRVMTYIAPLVDDAGSGPGLQVVRM
jgi:hypothetical protein